jgi:hypothetical protein
MSINNKLCLLYATFIIFTFAACKKGGTSGDDAVVPGSVPFVQASGLYITGYVYLKDSIFAATAWKDGATFSLPAKNSIARAITTSGTDVYIAGTSNKDALYWKNGIASVLFDKPANSQADVTGIAVVGNDVYVSGDIVSPGSSVKAAYWKNGVLNYLPATPTSYSGTGANSIMVSGTDVYITGTSSGKDALWKNGVLTSVQGSVAAISGNDIYKLVTDANYNFFYDKNNIQYALPTGGKTGFSATHKIVVKGNDVYVLGEVFSNSIFSAAYTKNGVMTILTGNPNAFPDCTGTTICVDNNNNVYVAGTAYNDSYTRVAAYWKNGKLMSTTLATTFSNATGIAFVE